MKRMEEKGRILRAIKRLKPEIQRRFKVKEIGLFGSVVRGEVNDDSDIDILVDFEGDASLFELVGLALFLEERLKRKVDVVSKRALREEIREPVLREDTAI